MIPSHWMPHRRTSDRELVGYLMLDGGAFVPLTLFGYALGEGVELEEAEGILDERGLSVLADGWVLAGGSRIPAIAGGEAPQDRDPLVRILEVTPDRVRVIDDDTGAAAVVGANLMAYDLPVPTDALHLV